MTVKKLKLVYDVSLIRNGLWKNSGRSGIYFVVRNVLRVLAKREDVELSLYCNPLFSEEVRTVLLRDFSGIDLNVPPNFFCDLYGKLKLQKKVCKQRKEWLKRFFTQISLLPVSLCAKLLLKFDRKDHLEKSDSFLSPVYKIKDSLAHRSYVILYDLIPLLFPKHHNLNWKRGAWLYDICSSLNFNDHYFAISDQTRNDFLEHFPQIDPNKIKTTLLACDDSFRPTTTGIDKIKSKYNIPRDKKYVFSLCSLEPRKNLQRTVSTFIEFIKKHNINNLVFVLGGGHWDSFIETMERTIGALGEYKKFIIKAGYIDDEDLPALYSNAEWFTYTSMYEGFGLPPLEAMSCGCPVITSNNSSLPEVVGDAGIMIDWDSDEQHIAAYEKYYFDKELRAENAKKGLERSKLFSWEKCVDEMIQTMRDDIRNNR